MRRAKSRLLRVIAGLWVLGPGMAAAQAAGPTVEDRAAAAQAYDRASAAYLAQQYERAASLYETAYRVLPNSIALLQAARAHQRADHPARAATLAARLVRRFGDDSAARAEMEALLTELEPRLVQIALATDGHRTWELDAALQDEEDEVVFAPPGEHAVRVTFATGSVELDASGGAGDRLALTAEPPVAPEPTEDAPDASTDPAPALASVERAPADGGIEPWLFVTTASATAVAAGFLIAFGVDAWSGLDAYRAEPTRAGLEDGQARELRTNVMFGVAGGLALSTFVIALFTDWDGDVEVGGSASPDGATLAVRGRLP